LLFNIPLSETILTQWPTSPGRTLSPHGRRLHQVWRLYPDNYKFFSLISEVRATAGLCVLRTRSSDSGAVEALLPSLSTNTLITLHPTVIYGQQVALPMPVHLWRVTTGWTTLWGRIVSHHCLYSLNVYVDTASSSYWQCSRAGSRLWCLGLERNLFKEFYPTKAYNLAAGEILLIYL
jgi:hypothetical protein